MNQGVLPPALILLESETSWSQVAGAVLSVSPYELAVLGSYRSAR
jgi:hypothetical protein